MISYNGRLISNGGVIASSGAYDINSGKLINAIKKDGGIVSEAVANAWNTLVINGKNNEWIYKCLALYPLIGGTLSSCKFNGIAPYDNDESFRITYNGVPDVSANGLSFDGTSVKGNCNTNIEPQSNGFGYSQGGGIFFYSRTNIAGTEHSAGMYSLNKGIWLSPKQATALSASGGVQMSAVAQNLKGLHYISRDALSTRIVYYRNEIKIIEDLANVYNGYFNDKTNDVIKFGGMFESPSTNYYSKQEFAFFGVTLGMTDAEYLLMEADILAFQTTLGRNV